MLLAVEAMPAPQSSGARPRRRRKSEPGFCQIRWATIELAQRAGILSGRTWEAFVLVHWVSREYGRSRKAHRALADAWLEGNAPDVDKAVIFLASISVSQLREMLHTKSNGTAQAAIGGLRDAGVLICVNEGTRRKKEPSLYIIGPLPETGAADSGEGVPPGAGDAEIEKLKGSAPP